MKLVGKYNLFKGMSIMITVVPVMLATFSQRNLIIKDGGTSVSFAAVIGVLIAFLMLKNKIAENVKMPSAFIISTILFVTIVMIEQILIPVKLISLTAMISCGIDELSFKRIYKRLELRLPELSESYKHFGLYLVKTDKLLGESNK